jgi:hypothetical protein
MPAEVDVVFSLDAGLSAGPPSSLGRGSSSWPGPWRLMKGKRRARALSLAALPLELISDLYRAAPCSSPGLGEGAGRVDHDLPNRRTWAGRNAPVGPASSNDAPCLCRIAQKPFAAKSAAGLIESCGELRPGRGDIKRSHIASAVRQL